MEFEQHLVEGVRAALARARNVSEVRMFGGIGFMVNGNLLVAASARGLLARVGRQREAEALSRPGARPMEMGGRRMRGYVYVDPPALDAKAIAAWVDLARAFVRTLPVKARTAARPRKRPA
jgi:TfoX/Sxy family transcriptional regulator of competence genes